MKKIILMFALMFASSATLAQAVMLTKSILCGDHNDSIEVLKQKYGEKAYWKGETLSNTTVIFFLNPETKTWTLIETDGKMACSIAVGETIEALQRIKH